MVRCERLCSHIHVCFILLAVTSNWLRCCVQAIVVVQNPASMLIWSNQCYLNFSLSKAFIAYIHHTAVFSMVEFPFGRFCIGSLKVTHTYKTKLFCISMITNHCVEMAWYRMWVWRGCYPCSQLFCCTPYHPAVALPPATQITHPSLTTSAQWHKPPSGPPPPFSPSPLAPYADNFLSPVHSCRWTHTTALPFMQSVSKKPSAKLICR